MFEYIKILRIHQWLKNLLVFIPMLAAHKFSDQYFYNSLIAFISFSLVASGVYMMNDIGDLKFDKLNPANKNRPLASGKVQIKFIKILLIFFLGFGFLISLLLSKSFSLSLFVYLLLASAYTFFFKKIRYFDLILLMSFYLIRLISGGIATEIPISIWLLFFSIFIFLFLAIIKRFSEIRLLNFSLNKTTLGRGYAIKDLKVISILAIISGYASIIIFSIYINIPAVQVLYPNNNLLWLVFANLLFWINRILYLTYRGKMLHDQIVFFLKDPFTYLSIAFIFLSVIFASKP